MQQRKEKNENNKDFHVFSLLLTSNEHYTCLTISSNKYNAF